MVTAKIKCFECRNKFEYYFSLRRPDEEIKCPHCLQQMEDKHAEKMSQAAGYFADANKEFWKSASDRGGDPPFTFDLFDT